MPGSRKALARYVKGVSLTTGKKVGVDVVRRGCPTTLPCSEAGRDLVHTCPSPALTDLQPFRCQTSWIVSCEGFDGLGENDEVARSRWDLGMVGEVVG